AIAILWGALIATGLALPLNTGIIVTVDHTIQNLIIFLPFVILLFVTLRRSGRWERRVIAEELADEIGGAVTTQEYDAIRDDGIFRTRRVDRMDRRRSAALVNAQHELAFRKWRVRCDGADPSTDPLVAGWRHEIAAMRALAALRAPIAGNPSASRAQRPTMVERRRAWSTSPRPTACVSHMRGEAGDRSSSGCPPFPPATSSWNGSSRRTGAGSNDWRVDTPWSSTTRAKWDSPIATSGRSPSRRSNATSTPWSGAWPPVRCHCSPRSTRARWLSPMRRITRSASPSSCCGVRRRASP